MSILNLIRLKLGASITPANNFTLDASADNGTMRLYRGNAGAPIQDVLTVSSTGVVTGGVGSTLVGNGPVLRVSRITTDQPATPLSTFIKVQFNSVDVDSGGYWDAANFRYRPLVAGHYHVEIAVFVVASVASSEIIGAVFKNGAETLFADCITNPSTRGTATISGIVFLNGSTDYIEGFANVGAGASPMFNALPARTYMSAVLVRAA